MDYSKVRSEQKRSNKRLKVGIDVEQRAEMAEEKRLLRAHRQHLRRVKQEQEDRERYIIPEFQDLEELLTG